MSFNQSILLSLAVVVLSLTFSCKNDDDGGNKDPDTLTSTCCQVPHLEACVGGAEIFIPNAFTANADGFNDIFYPFGGQGIKEIISFKIYKENDIVFEEQNFQPNDPGRGWDGILPDGTIEDGVFTYTISITNVADETYDFDGAVCCRTGFFPCVDLENHCVYGVQHDGAGGFDLTLPNLEDCQ